MSVVMIFKVVVSTLLGLIAFLCMNYGFSGKAQSESEYLTSILVAIIFILGVFAIWL